MGKFSRTWEMMGMSWRVLKKDKEMLVFPLLAGICCLAVLATFAIPMIGKEEWAPPDKNAPTSEQVAYYGTLFLFYFASYFFIVFFNSAVIACAVMRMVGKNPNLNDGFKASFSRLPLILGWAFVAATVGLILRIIEDRSEKVGRFVAGLIGMAWSVVSFLVIPILVVERKSPMAALKESTALLKKTWGEQLIGNFSFGLVFLALGFLGMVVVAMGIALLPGLGIIFWVGLAIVYFVILALVQSALQSIFQAAIYLYAKDGQIGEGFSREVLVGAMRER